MICELYLKTSIDKPLQLKNAKQTVLHRLTHAPQHPYKLGRL